MQIYFPRVLGLETVLKRVQRRNILVPSIMSRKLRRISLRHRSKKIEKTLVALTDIEKRGDSCCFASHQASRGPTNKHGGRRLDRRLQGQQGCQGAPRSGHDERGGRGRAAPIADNRQRQRD